LGALNQHLRSNVPLSDNLLKSASRLLSARRFFFDSRSSDEIRSVYYYFAACQSRLAILLTDYYHARPDVYTHSVAKGNLEAIEGNVTAQASSLKPPVPDGTVLDTRTGAMWSQTSNGSPLRSLNDLAHIVQVHLPGHGHQLSDEFKLRPAATDAALPGLPFCNWRIPTGEDLHKLLSHRTGNGVDCSRTRRASPRSFSTRPTRTCRSATHFLSTAPATAKQSTTSSTPWFPPSDPTAAWAVPSLLTLDGAARRNWA
jgi:hypothetical protein